MRSLILRAAEEETLTGYPSALLSHYVIGWRAPPLTFRDAFQLSIAACCPHWVTQTKQLSRAWDCPSELQSQALRSLQPQCTGPDSLLAPDPNAREQASLFLCTAIKLILGYGTIGIFTKKITPPRLLSREFLCTTIAYY